MMCEPRPINPLVSVILPTFNRLQYIPQAIESVFSQTYSNWELIIADDGSEEKTRAYLRAVATRPRVKVIWLPHLGNPAAARNAGLREARGEYIAFIDSDDLWMPRKLEVQVGVLRADAACAWSYTEFIRTNHILESIDAERDPHRVLFEGIVVRQLLEARPGIAVPAVMATRALLERAGGFDEEQGIHEDYELWARLALLSPLRAIREPLTYVRRHTEHFNRGGLQGLQARRRILEKMSKLVTNADDRSVLRAQRRRNALQLAYLNAVAGNRKSVWRVLAGSWRYSWRSGAWYLGCAKAVARAFVPAWLMTIVRRRRNRYEASLRAGSNAGA